MIRKGEMTVRNTKRMAEAIAPLAEGKPIVVNLPSVPPIDNCKSWPRYDPCLGAWLCHNCWNNRPQGLRHQCTLGLCECPCTDMKPPQKQRFTAEGQMEIDMSNPIHIGPKS
jgi:hypothetical protein